jgi:hypothetical protein
MPVTSFALLLLSACLAAVFTVWAVSAWGVMTVLPALLLLVLLARWALAPVPHDDGHT